jgi:tetratricopeptide (TPR) repeat protein
VVFQILSANAALNALSNVHTHHAAISVDSLDLARCDLIKIDVERTEGEAIAGAVRTIRRFRPVLYVENDRQEKSAALIRQLFALDYRLYWHLPPLFNPQNYFGVAENIFAGTVSINMLGIHASSPLSVAGFREITDPDEPCVDAIGRNPRGAPLDAGGGVVMVGLSPPQERTANSADELNQIGIRLAQQGRLEEALLSFRRALQIQPSLAQTHNNLGIALQDQGRLEEAVASYRRALALKPDYAMAYNNLGTALKEQAKLDEATACFRRACQLKPDDVMACSNLANALKEQGQLAEAAACYRRIVELKPDFAEGYANLGGVLRDQGSVGEAVACCRRALELKPDLAEALANLGVALGDQGKLDEAVACCRRALELRPDCAEVHYNLGVAFRGQGKLDDAVACCRRALELKPDFAEAHFNLGNALKEQGKLDEAVACCRRALELKPDFADARNNLGNVLKEQGKLDEAVACHRRALELKPDFAEAHANLGAALTDQGRLEEAMACYRRALELQPDLPDARFNRSLLLLVSGDFQHGWPEYEWRWRTKGHRPLPFRQPLWDGRPLPGKTMLLHAEQGLGDTIQFLRYAALVKDRGPKVIVEIQGPLVRLLASCRGVDESIGRGNDLPTFDVYAPLASLPGIFHTSLETIPAEVPYLFADSGLIEHWRAELGPIAAFKIGIFWQGTTTDPARIIPLNCFESLAGLPGVQFFSLQKGPGVEQLQDLAGRFPITELGSRLDDFMDTAAVLRNLDLVIACDTAVAHLAGAMGLSVWVALPFAADWRWLLDRDDSPWYPTMRLFRQKKRGDWADVFDQLKTALASRLMSFDGQNG